MSKKKIVAFIPADENNTKFYEMCRNSLRKFHTEEDLPLLRYDLTDNQDPMKWYKATPMLAKDLIKEYEVVLKLDADQIITGNLSEAWNGDFDVAVVQNSNPRENAANPINCLDIHPFQYVNCGFVVMRNEKFVNHWWDLCQSYHFNNWQYREQDLLNIMIHYGNYKIKWLDATDNKWWGLIEKGYETLMKLENGKLILPKNEEWPVDNSKQIVCYHFAGGNDPSKGNYRIRFQPDIVKWIDKLIKP